MPRSITKVERLGGPQLVSNLVGPSNSEGRRERCHASTPPGAMRRRGPLGHRAPCATRPWRRTVQAWSHRLHGPAPQSLRQRQGRELHEDTQGRSCVSDGIRNLRGRYSRPSPLHRRGLQHPQTPLRAGLSEPRANLRCEPLEWRKATLAKLLARAGYGVQLNQHLEAEGPSNLLPFEPYLIGSLD